MNKNTYNYRISLRPLDYYFFGGESTFGNGEQQSYYAKTRLFPQQTTVLGVLRHLGFDKVDIGESFDAAQPNTAQSFGYIEGISPLFLSREDGRHYLPGSLGRGKTGAYALQTAGDNVKHWNNGDWISTYQLPDYRAKDGWQQGLTAGKTTHQTDDFVSFDDVFKTFTKVGITKQKDGAERKDGFYKQYLAKLANGWSFTILAQLNEELVSQLPASSVMPFGGEKALFHLQVEKLEAAASFEDYFPKQLWQHTFPSDQQAIMLLSDAWVHEAIYDKCTFAISNSKDFRNIRTPKKVRQYARFYTHPEWKELQQTNASLTGLHKSGKYNLLVRGSLLYGQASDLKPLLDQPAYQSIGYNHYTVLSNLKNQ